MTYTNLTTLPDNLHETWHQLSTLYFEHSLIMEFPKTLLSIQLTEVSLHGNLIERIPELALTHQYFLSFTVNANPLVELPETLGEGTVFTYFSAERTLIKTLPAWAYTGVDEVVYLYGTPYCEMQPGDEFNGTYLVCVESDNRVNGKVPVEIFDPRIPL